MNRRGFLAGLVGSAGLALSACASRTGRTRTAPRPGPLALVYRGPAACDGCAEAVAALLRTAPERFDVAYCGPHEQLPLSADTLRSASVYAQAGGGDVDPTWTSLCQHAADIRDWVHGGGCYLGFCLGGYLAGTDPGFGLLPGDADRYVSRSDATVTTTDDTIIAVQWRGRSRHMYFQDGPTFTLDPGAGAAVLATYSGGEPAAVVASFGAGRVGVVGPHPEADQSWYDDEGLTNPDGVRFDLGYDLVRTTLAR